MRARPSLPATLFVIILITGWSLAAMLPLGQAADEPAHAIRVEALSHGQFLGHREAREGGFTTTKSLLAVGTVTPSGQPQRRAERREADTLDWEDDAAFLDLGTVATYFPAAYVPAALAVAAARALDITPAIAFRLARGVDLTLYAAIAAAAVGWARRGRALIAATMLLPMALGLAASLSGDGMLIAMAALAASGLTRRNAGGWWLAAGLLTLIGLTKLPYAPLLLVPLMAGPPLLPARIVVLTLAGVAMLGWAGLNQAEVMGVLGHAPYEAGPLWPEAPRVFTATDPVAQVQVLRAHPAQVLILVARTMATDVWLVRQAIGVLGWLHIVLPDWMYAMWSGVLAAAVLGLLAEGEGPRPWAALGALGGIGLSVWAIMLAQYLSWTPVGAAAIEGIQGRYFLPLLPFLAVSVPGVWSARTGWLPWVAVMAGIAGLAVLPMVVALASYLR